MKKIVIKILIVVLIIFISLITVNYFLNKNRTYKDAISKDYSIEATASSNDKTYYYININEKQIMIDSSLYSLPTNLYDYNEDILLRVIYSKNYEIYDVKVVDKLTNKVLTNISNNKIYKKYSIEVGKKVVELDWVENIKLSELKENVIYKYTALKNMSDSPNILNDTNDNCIVYEKEHSTNKFKYSISTSKNISSSFPSISYNEYEKGDTYSIIYKKIDNKEFLNKVDGDRILKLSEYNSGDELNYSFEEFIYNDTDNDIILAINDSYSEKKEYEITINKNKIIGFDRMIDSINIK